MNNMTKGATTPPTCGLCGAAHWLREPHQFSGRTSPPELQTPRPNSQHERQMIDVTPTPPEDKTSRKAKPRPSKNAGAPRRAVAAAALAEAEKPKKGRPKATTDRAAYRAEWARKKRIADKANKT